MTTVLTHPCQGVTHAWRLDIKRPATGSQDTPPCLCAALQGTNRISYTEFKEALQLIASEKKVQVNDVVQAITLSQGPMLNVAL